MKIKTDEITSVIKQEIEQFSADLEVSEVGRVVEVGDGIARVYGLSKAMAGELLEFDSEHGSIMGQVMNLELDTVGAVLFGDYLAVKEGDTVKSTGRLLEVPVGDGTHLILRSSITVNRMPSATPTKRAGTAPAGSASKPCDRISAKPARRREMGDERPAFSPTMPYVSRSSGYIHETAMAPTGVPSSCMMVMLLGEDPIM